MTTTTTTMTRKLRSSDGKGREDRPVQEVRAAKRQLGEEQKAPKKEPLKKAKFEEKEKEKEKEKEREKEKEAWNRTCVEAKATEDANALKRNLDEQRLAKLLRLKVVDEEAAALRFQVAELETEKAELETAKAELEKEKAELEKAKVALEKAKVALEKADAGTAKLAAKKALRQAHIEEAETWRERRLASAMEFFTVKRERDALLGAKMQAMGNVLLSSRLAAFALAPVCAGLKCDRAAEAIASFVKTGVAGRRTGSDGDSDLRSPDWARLHARQVSLVNGLEAQLPSALAPAGLAARTAALASALEAAGATGISSAANGSATRLSGQVDSTPVLLDALFGRNEDAAVSNASVKVLASFMAVYDAGGVARRVRGDGLTIDVTESTSPAKTTSPGTEAAKWLIDDDLLISAALGLL